MTDSHHMGRPARPRLAIVVTHPIQYYAPIYRCLAEHRNIDVHVIYLSDAGATAHRDPGFGRTIQWDVPLLAGYDYMILQPGADVTARGFWGTHARELCSALAKIRPDWLMVYGYASRMNWVAVWWARSNGVRVLYASDSNSRNPERFVRIKKLVVGHFFRQVDVFLSPSERNVEYLLRYGANAQHIHRIPFAIDVARFAPDDNDTGTHHYDFLWAGKFIELKRGVDFIDALARLAQRSGRRITACMAGDGPCRAELQARARILPGHCLIDFPGFINQSGMPTLLRSAQTFVFTSERDAYGLAVTEAAAAGAALVVADNNGCVGSSVIAQPDVNALTYQVGDVPALAAAMARLLDDPALLARMQRASLDIAKYHDADHAAAVIESVVIGGSGE